MNKHCKPLLLMGLMAVSFTFKSAACGYAWISDCSSQIHLRINGVLDSFNIADCPYGYNYNGTQLGNLQSFSLANAKAITWESCQNNVSNVLLWYRVYEQGFAGGSWQSLSLNEYYQVIDGPYTTRYRSHPVNISLTTGLTPGKSYTMELYLLAEIDTLGDDFIPETTLLRNNNGANYKLSFTYGGAAAPPVSILAHKTLPSCYGSSDGRISASVYGDLTGIFYHWSNVNLNFFQQNNLPAGAYSLTVTNALGQSAVETIQLTQPDLLQCSFSNVQSVGCNNNPGAATATPTGGTPPYSYKWQTGQQTASATLPFSGTWQVTVTDAHQCTSTGSVFIANTGQVQHSQSDVLCSGQVYTIYGQNFTHGGNYSFLVPGINGCDTLVMLSLTELNPWQAFAPLPESIELSCTNPQVLLCAAALPNATYSWKKDGIPVQQVPCIEATAGGVYVLDIALGACMATKTIQATAHLTPPTATITGIVRLYCNSSGPAWLRVTSDAAAPSYIWEYNGAVISSSDSCLFQVTAFDAGMPVFPTLQVTDAYGCKSSAFNNQIAIIQDTMSPGLMVSASDASGINIPDGVASVSIGNGLPPYAVEWSTGAATLSISGLLPGEYCVTVVGANGCSTTRCITVYYPLTSQHPDLSSAVISPNPAFPGETISIAVPVALEQDDWLLELFDQGGAMLQSTLLAPSSKGVFLLQLANSLHSGASWIRATNRERTITGKIIIL